MRLLPAALAVLATIVQPARAGELEDKGRVVSLGGGVTMQLVLVPPGAFTMGSSEEALKTVRWRWPELKEEMTADEAPAHKVTISKSFWMGKHEVTVAQFRRFAEDKAYQTGAEKGGALRGAVVVTAETAKNEAFAARTMRDASWRNPFFRQTDDHPVTCVTWHDAQAFVAWLNAFDKAKPPNATYRLPTEAEWEYACRAGAPTHYQWGDDPDKGKGWCNAADLVAKKAFPAWTAFFWDDGFLYTAPVGSFRPNAFGLHDMHGNVWEWCQDWHGPYKADDQTDPTGPDVGAERVVRGGGWDASPATVRSAFRGRNQPSLAINNVGFRIVLAPGPL